MRNLIFTNCLLVIITTYSSKSISAQPSYNDIIQRNSINFAVLVLDYETLTPEGINITYYPYNDVCNIFNSPVYTDFNNGVNSFILKNTDFVVFETTKNNCTLRPVLLRTSNTGQNFQRGMEGQDGSYQKPRKRTGTTTSTSQKKPTTTHSTNNQNRRPTTYNPQKRPTEERSRGNNTVQPGRHRTPTNINSITVSERNHTIRPREVRPTTGCRNVREIRNPIVRVPNRPNNNIIYIHPDPPIEYPIICPILVRPTTSYNTIIYPTDFYYNDYLLGEGYTSRKPSETIYYNSYGYKINGRRYDKDLAWEAIRYLKITEYFAMTGYNITLHRNQDKLIVMYFQKRKY